jgi:DNA polymerase I-like protein with 3'-5' exonuclease and polymerase domains
LFWLPDEPKITPVRRPTPPIPQTGWKNPEYLPDLSGAKVIAFDTETFDPELLTAGPGWSRGPGKGHVIGLSVATDCGYKNYFPIRHELGGNMDPTAVLEWAKVQLGRKHQPKVTVNGTYDVGWMQNEGVKVEGFIYDCAFAEALIDENAEQNLEALGQKYLGMGKESNLMYKWLADAYGGKEDGSQRANMYRCPVELAGPYAVSDAVLPLHVFRKQWEILQREGLLDVFMMETRLIPMMIAMRFRGVRVDLPRAQTISDQLDEQLGIKLEELRAQCGFRVNVNSSHDLAKLFDKFGYDYNTTAEGNPSFTAEFLKGTTHSLGKFVVETREIIKMKDTFIRSAIMGKQTSGRVHPSFKQMKSEGGGTISGRFGCSTPNVQQAPARTKLGKLIRELFVPEFDEVTRALDLSSIEYRVLAHYAVGQGADEVRAAFNADPELDFHQLVCDMINDMTGVGITRKATKTINFGLLYGMGLDKLAISLALPTDAATNLIDSYFEASPYARQTLDHYSNEASRTGFVTTYLGRKARFDYWVPNGRGGRAKQPLPYDRAVAAYGPRLQRVGLHKAVNRVLQGSAADCMKAAMLRMWEEGLADVFMPTMTIHDELVFSYDGSKIHQEALLASRECMENPFPSRPMRIPLLSACDGGASWGAAEELPRNNIL